MYISRCLYTYHSEDIKTCGLGQGNTHNDRSTFSSHLFRRLLHDTVSIDQSPTHSQLSHLSSRIWCQLQATKDKLFVRRGIPGHATSYTPGWLQQEGEELGGEPRRGRYPGIPILLISR
jgi:hypothetical protein